MTNNWDHHQIFNTLRTEPTTSLSSIDSFLYLIFMAFILYISNYTHMNRRLSLKWCHAWWNWIATEWNYDDFNDKSWFVSTVMTALTMWGGSLMQTSIHHCFYISQYRVLTHKEPVTCITDDPMTAQLYIWNSLAAYAGFMAGIHNKDLAEMPRPFYNSVLTCLFPTFVTNQYASNHLVWQFWQILVILESTTIE